MAAYRRVHDSRHLQADCQEPGISSGTLRSVIEYGLPLPFIFPRCVPWLRLELGVKGGLIGRELRVRS